MFENKKYSDYFTNWNDTNVDIIYSGYGFEFESEINFYNSKDMFRHLNPNRHFFPLYFLYHMFYFYNREHADPPIINYDIKYHFTSYNRNARPHRLYILQLLKDNGLLDNNLYSCFDYSGFNIENFSYFTYPHFNFNDFNVPINYLDESDIVNSGNYWKIFPSYVESSFQQVTESVVEPIFLTEKTFLPIINKKPFLTFGAPHINETLTKFGFKLYDDIFDYSFDKVKLHVIRAKEYVKEIKRVCETYTPQEIHDKLKDVTEYNYNNAIDIIKNKKHIPNIFLKWEEEHRNNDVWKTHMSPWYYGFEENLKNY